ncbi:MULTISPECIES: FMN-binding protein [unclassified Frankia]|uniref:FMN-binding protein n=1 Tax=unclassified Frankia TaxID=2632575 RepID=UPI002023C49C
MNENAGKSHRARLGLAALLATVGLVVGAKAATGPGERPVALAVAPATAGTGQRPATAGGVPAPDPADEASGSAGSDGHDGSAADDSGRPAGSGSGGAGGATSVPSSPAAGGSSGTATTRTVTGDAVRTRYGFVQVQVVLSGKTITDVVALRLPDRERRDIEINNWAVPILRQEVLDVQSARIDTVSGASYTSDGYAQSVQSALDRAGA